MMDAIRMSRALAAGAIAIVATSAWAGEVTVFSDRDFRGTPMTVRGPSPNLTQIGFSDTASSLVVRDGVWEVCTRPYFEGHCLQLQPGEYSSLGTRLDGRIASLREVTQTIGAAPPNAPQIQSGTPAKITLYEHTGFGGRSVTLTGAVHDLDRVQFGDSIDSAVVYGGTWRLCDSAQSACIELAPGRYESLGVLNGRVAIADVLNRPAATPLPQPTPPVVQVSPPAAKPAPGAARVTFYQYPNFRGDSVIVDRPVISQLDARTFANGAGSMRIEGGTWFFCSDANFGGHCQTFGPGEYAYLPWTQNRVASGYYVPERVSLR